MMVATALVLLMSLPGLALFYAGMVRKKNVLATTAQTLATAALATVLWVVVGYSLAFSGSGAWIGDLGRFLMGGMTVEAIHPNAKTIPESVFAFYQMTFAIITPALVLGAVADRMKFSAMLWFMGLWLLVVYVPMAHWVWGGGFLQTDGVLDFAGGIVVHINAGIAGLVAAIVLGPRRNYGHENMAPYNLVLAVIGVSLLWVGWMGFNGGSALAADGRAGMAMLVTHVAAATAALAWMFAEWLTMGKPSVLGIISGAVAGLGSITPAAGYIGIGPALLIGLVAGAACFYASTALKKRLGLRRLARRLRRAWRRRHHRHHRRRRLRRQLHRRPRDQGPVVRRQWQAGADPAQGHRRVPGVVGRADLGDPHDHQGDDRPARHQRAGNRGPRPAPARRARGVRRPDAISATIAPFSPGDVVGNPGAAERRRPVPSESRLMIKLFSSLAAVPLALAAVALAACGEDGPSRRGPAGGFYEAVDPVADGVSSAFRRPIREADVQSVLSAHIRSPLYRRDGAADPAQEQLRAVGYLHRAHPAYPRRRHRQADPASRRPAA